MNRIEDQWLYAKRYPLGHLKRQELAGRVFDDEYENISTDYWHFLGGYE